ncbi:MAG: hypothetical protein ACFFE8_01310 [Candidatus Heimdallarchaeota archaeon]
MSRPTSSSKADRLKDLAWEILCVSAFRQSERQSLNLIITLSGVSSQEEASELLSHLFRLVRKGTIYIPEARLEIFKEAPERVDVYLTRNFHETMRDLGDELRKLHITLDNIEEELPQIPQKVLIDLKNQALGKYIDFVK